MADTTKRTAPTRAGGTTTPHRFRAPGVPELAEIADRLALVTSDEELVPALVAALAPIGVAAATVGFETDDGHVVFPIELGDADLGPADDPSRELPVAGTPVETAFATAGAALVDEATIESRYPLLAARRVRRGALLFVPVDRPAAPAPEAPALATEHDAREGRGILILALPGPSGVLRQDDLPAYRLLGSLVSETLRRLAATRRERLGKARRTLVARAIAELLPPADPSTTSGRILELATSLTGAERAVLFERQGEELVVVAVHGLSVETTAPGERIPLDSTTAVAEAARTGGPVITGGPSAYAARFPSMADRFTTAGNQALVALPLRSGPEVSGSLGLGFGNAYDPSPADIEALTSFAGAATAALDASRLRAAEASIRRTLEGVVSQMPLGVAVADATGKLLLVNERVAAIWGDVLPTGSAEGYGAWVGYHEDGERYRWDEWPLVRALAGETVDGEEVEIDRFDGERAHTRQWAAPIRADDGALQGALVVLADVTAEAEVAKLRDAFIGVLSHELRTPITTIYGAAQLLARPTLAPEMRAELTADIASEADRLMRMVQNLLVIARIERGVSVGGDDPIALERTVRRCIEAEAHVRPDLAVDVEVAPGIPVVSGDEGYLEQVLRNLISNGVKYGGGRLTVTVRPDGEGAAIEVADRGQGFPADGRDRLWDLFHRGRNAGGNPGAGIGLFVCRRLVEAMGGAISIADRPGGGGVVTVHLPARTLAPDEVDADAPLVGG